MSSDGLHGAVYGAIERLKPRLADIMDISEALATLGMNEASDNLYKACVVVDEELRNIREEYSADLSKQVKQAEETSTLLLLSAMAGAKAG